MPKKWELASPIIKNYIKEHGDQYLNELSNTLNISPYVINFSCVIKKTQKACLERYGVKTNLISNDPKLNGHDSIIKRFGSDKARYEYTIKKNEH